MNLALSSLEDGKLKQRAEIEMTRALRLTQQWRQLSSHLGSINLEQHSCQQELQWELLCLRISRAPNDPRYLQDMRQAIDIGGSHYSGSYWLEACFWFRCLPFIQVESLPKMDTLRRKKGFFNRTPNQLTKIARCFENADDTQYSLVKRVGFIRKATLMIDEIQAVDRKLLIWMATSRWLNSHNLIYMADQTHQQYQALSLQVTAGRSQDALAVDQHADTKSKRSQEIPS